MRSGVVLFMLVFWLWNAPAQAQKLVFVFEQYPPYEYIDEHGNLAGVDVSLIREVCKRNGIEPEFREVPWKRAMDEVKIGLADAIFSLFKTPKRQEFLIFPDIGLSSEKNIFVAVAESGVQVRSLDDLDGLTVGVTTDYVYSKAFNEAVHFKRESSNDAEMLLAKVLMGHSDVAIINDLVFHSVAKDMDALEKFEVMDYVDSVQPMYVAFSKNSSKDPEKMADIFSKTLRELKQEGFLLGEALWGM